MTTVALDVARRAREDGPLVGGRARAGPCGASRRPARRRAPDEVEDVRAVLAAPDPVLVLDRDDVDAAAQRMGGAVGSRRARRAGSGDGPRGGTAVARSGRMQRDDLAVRRRRGEVVGEGGDAAAAGRVGGRRRRFGRWRCSCRSARRQTRWNARARRRRLSASGEWSAARQGGDDGDPPRDGPSWAAQAARTWVARGPLGLSSISNSPARRRSRRSKSSEESSAAAMEEVFLRILGGDEAEAAIGDDLLDGTGGHDDLQRFPNKEWQSARSVREGGRPRGASPREAARRQP